LGTSSRITEAKYRSKVIAADEQGHDQHS